MAEARIRETAGTTAENGSQIPTRQRWFCAGVSPSRDIFKIESDSPESFREKLSNATIAWVDYVTQGTEIDIEAINVASQLGFSQELVTSFIGQPYLTYQDLDTEVVMKLPSIQVRELAVTAYPLLLLLSKNFIFTIHPLNVDRRFTRLRRYAEAILKRIPLEAVAQDRLTILLTRIIDHNNDRNFEHLRQIEEWGDKLSESLTDFSQPRTEVAPKIHEMKHALIVYLNALWDSLDVLHTLRYGEADLITDDPKLQERLGVLAEDVNRQIALSEHLSEVLASGLEALQSIYNNQLQAVNNRLSYAIIYLTVIGTAILVPNTIATILGDTTIFSDLSPKSQVWYWPLMVGATAVSTFLAYWWVRRSGLIPKKME